MRTIYIFYRTDPWHSFSSREMVYVTDNVEDGIAQCIAHRGMTEKQGDDIRTMHQSQGNNTDTEWDVDVVEINTFVD